MSGELGRLRFALAMQRLLDQMSLEVTFSGNDFLEKPLMQPLLILCVCDKLDI